MDWQSILQRQQGWTVEKANMLRLSVAEATELYTNAPLHELTKAADNRRRQFHPEGNVTYLVDRNVNYTNVCTINCQFCSFYRPPGHDETYTQSYKEISHRISELEDIGGSRILMQGGVNPELEFTWYIDLIKFLVSEHPDIDLDCFNNVDCVINLAGFSVFSLWTNANKTKIFESRVGSTNFILDVILKKNIKIKSFVNASAIAAYRDSSDFTSSENDSIDNPN